MEVFACCKSRPTHDAMPVRAMVLVKVVFEVLRDLVFDFQVLHCVFRLLRDQGTSLIASAWRSTLSFKSKMFTFFCSIRSFILN